MFTGSGLGRALHCAVSGSPPEANLQTAARLVCNCFRHQPTRAWLAAHQGPLLELFSGCYSAANKNVRLSITTLLLDLSVMLRSGAAAAGAGGGGGADDKIQLLSAITELLGSVPAEEEDSAFRALLAFGTLLMGDREVCSLARDLGASELVRAFANSANEKLRDVASDIAVASSSS